MPISQQIGSSSLAKPGVCTSTTRPASPYNGQVIYETDTARTLVWNGSGWVFLSTSTANPVGLELITSCTVTSAGGTAATASGGVVTIGTSNTSVTVSNAFSSSYDNYKILISGGSASTSNVLTCQLGSTTSGYYYGLVATAFNTTPIADGSTAGSNWLYFGNGAIDGLTADATVQNPYLSKRTGFTAPIHWGGGTGYAGVSSGFLNNTTSYTAFTIGTNTGTLTGGTIRVYGYRNSA